MRTFSHFTVRRAREGDAPAEPLPHRPRNVTPAKARQEPRPPARLTHAHCPPPTLGPLPTAFCHSSFENSSLPLHLLLPPLATRNPLLATIFPPQPPAPLHPLPAETLRKTSRQTSIFSASDATGESKTTRTCKTSLVLSPCGARNHRVFQPPARNSQLKLTTLCPFERDPAHSEGNQAWIPPQSS